ncbi:MATE family efflux transporter [bacterium]|nr:MATE family efflux transporter [bacterium]
MTETTPSNDLTSGSTWHNIWHMSWSMLLVMFLNFFVGLTDIYVAGFLGPEIQAVVGFVTELYFFVIIAANAISTGTVAMLSRAVGAHNSEKAVSIAVQSLVFAIACAISITIAGIIFHERLISLAGFSDSISARAGEFFVIFAVALVPNYIVVISNAIFRSGGEVRLTLIAMFFVSLINIVLDFLLVFGAAGWGGMGYRGIAFATAISMFAGMIICFALFKKSRWSDIFSGAWHLSGRHIRGILRISWPAALLQLAWNSGSIVLYNILGRLDEGSVIAMAALTSGLRIEAFIYLPMFALNMAASVLCGQTLGAGEAGRAERIGWKLAVTGVTFVSLLALPVFIWAGPVASVIAKDSGVLTETTFYLRVMMLSEPFMALSLILGGCLQGAGDTKGTMFVIVIALWAIRLPLAYLLAVTAGYGAAGVWAAMVISMFFQGIAMTFRYRAGGWKVLMVTEH